MRHLRLAAIVVAGVALASGRAAGDDEKVKALVEKVTPGVAELLGYADGQQQSGTGFLLNDKILITNFHVIDGVKTLSARLPKQRYVECKLIDVNKDLDLAALMLMKPVEGKPLQLAEKAPVLADSILIVGHPQGLSHTFFEGRINAATRTRAEIYQALGWNGTITEFMKSNKAIQHSAPSTNGMSGAPVINLDGYVVGVQREGVKDESNINFCIPHTDIKVLKLDKDPTEFGGTGPKEDFDKVLNAQSKVRPVGGGDEEKGRELRCYHWGTVAPNAEVIRARFINDKFGFDSFVLPQVLDGVLGPGKARWVHVTNPAFRFGFLVPSNYTLVQEYQTEPYGTRIILTNDDPKVRAPHNTIRIAAWRIKRPINTYVQPVHVQFDGRPPVAPPLREITSAGAAIRDGTPVPRKARSNFVPPPAPPLEMADGRVPVIRPAGDPPPKLPPIVPARPPGSGGPPPKLVPKGGPPPKAPPIGNDPPPKAPPIAGGPPPKVPVPAGPQAKPMGGAKVVYVPMRIDDSKWVLDLLTDLAWRYPAETYGIETFVRGKKDLPRDARREDAVVAYSRAKGPPLLTEFNARSFDSARSARYRVVLKSPDKFDVAWVFHFAVHDNVVIVVDYELPFAELENGPRNSYPRHIEERMVIGASLSLF